MTARRRVKNHTPVEDRRAADLVGVSSQAIRDAEKAGRLPHPDMETRGRVEQRVGYTIEQINHMRDVFGTRLRRSEDSFPPVIGVAAHKGGVYKTSVSVHLAQDLALKGLRVLLVEGNDPQGTASMYHGWVPDLHIHAEDTLLPFYLGEKDDASYAVKPTCWPGLDIIPSCLALHRIETELMGKLMKVSCRRILTLCCVWPLKRSRMITMLLS